MLVVFDGQQVLGGYLSISAIIYVAECIESIVQLDVTAPLLLAAGQRSATYRHLDEVATAIVPPVGLSWNLTSYLPA